MAKKTSKTLRQATEQGDKKPRKRRLRAPVSKLSKPLSKVKPVGRFIIPKYFRNSWRELKEVEWPDRRQTIKLTTAVIVFAIVFGIAIAIVDYGLDRLFREVLLK